MLFNRRLFVAVGVGMVAAACATPPSPLTRQQCINPAGQLAALLQPLEAQRAGGCQVLGPGGSECDRLRREVGRLSVICPSHAPTLMANAVLAYEDDRPAEAQQYLDVILSRPRSAPDAAALRARISLEEGNIPSARRLVEQHLRLAPDHAGLHETYASVLFLGGQMADAQRELNTASSLGAPRWRIAYHLGLIEEAAGRRAGAARFYGEALQEHPGWAQAETRLNALRAREGAVP